MAKMRGNLVKGLKLLSIMPFLVPTSALAIEVPVPAPSQLIITEVKVKKDGVYDEFIEFYNASNNTIDLSDYQLEYYNHYDIANVDVIHKGPVSIAAGELEPGSYYALARVQTQITDSGDLDAFTGSLKDSSGLLRVWGPDVINPEEPNIIQDQVAWSEGSSLPVGVHKIYSNNKSQSLQRHTSDVGVPVIDNAEWSLEDTPHPQSSKLILPPPPAEEETDPLQEPETPPAENTAPEPPTDTEEQPEAPAAPLLPPAITELLPNPAPPFTDSLDEFVEIYNPNDTPLEVTGYKVQTGNNYSYSYELTNITIPAHGYITVTSGNTNLSLANTGGKARLLDTQGVVVSEAVAYTEAPAGQSWANIDGTWRWTTTLTPAAANVWIAPKTSVKTPVTAKAKTTAKKSAAVKKASKKPSVKGASKKKAVPKQSVDTGSDNETPEIVPVHTGVLAIIGGLTLVYAGYEYRHDVLNRLYQFRRYREARRAARG